MLVTALLGVLVYRAVAKKTPAPVDNAYLETVRLELTSKPLLRLGLTIQAQEDAFLERRSLLLITSPACEFCVASSTFHNRLLTLARAQNVAFYIAAPKLDRAREYLRSAKLDQAKLLNWSNLSLKSRGTPTIALIESGIIRKLWVGRLEADLESQVSDSILHSGVPLSIPDYLPSGYANIAATKLQAQFGARPISIVDIRNRSEFKDGHLPCCEYSVGRTRDARRARATAGPHANSRLFDANTE